MAKTNLLKLAKGTNKKTVPASLKTAKTSAVKKIEKIITPEEERTLKAKRKVEELLQDVSVAQIKAMPVEEEQESAYSSDANEWLEEQTSMLGNDVEILRNELANAKEDYRILLEKYQANGNNNGIVLNSGNDGDVAKSVIAFFNDFQNNYARMQGNGADGKPNMLIWPTNFMKLMVQFFPFLVDYKRF